MVELFYLREINLSHLDLTKKLQLVWKVIPLGKGFYKFEFFFKRHAIGPLDGSSKLSHGFLILFVWTKDFVPATMKSTKDDKL